MQENIYKYRLKLSKTGALKFISHLDWQGVILKIFRRCNIKLLLSQGFNKMPKVSYSPALPIFIESDCELVNFQTYQKLDSAFVEDFQKKSPDGLRVVEFYEINDTTSLDNYVQWASYSAKIKNSVYNFDQMRYIIDKCLSSNEFLILKKTKKGIEKTVNYRSSIKSIEFMDNTNLNFTLKAGANADIPALRADDFLKNLFEGTMFEIKRTEFLDADLKKI